jgi:hypothetical protein
MSEVESHSKPVLKPLLRGDHNLTLNENDLATVRAWIVPRAIVLERGGAAHGAVPFYTDNERRTFADIEFEGSLEPMDGSYVWIFQYRIREWAARSNVLNGGLHMVPGGPQTHRFQVITAYVGRFGFQIVIGRWPERRRLELHSPSVRDWQPAMALIWPDAPGTIDWPPGGLYLGDGSYEAVLDRFIKPGFPLQRRHSHL